MQRPRTEPQLLRTVPLAGTALLVGAALSACSSSKNDGNKDETFVVKTTDQGVAPTTPLVMDDRWLAFLADEATTGPGGTDLNGDGDEIDTVPVRVNAVSGADQVIGVAAREIVFLNRTLFLVVDEAQDGTIWNGDAALDDVVLLYHQPGDTDPTFLATLATDDAPYVVDGTLFYRDAGGTTAAGETDLFYTTVPAADQPPTTPVRVTTSIVADGDGVEVRPYAVEQGMMFLSIDEAVDGDVNGDADADDTILALLDATVPGEEVVSTDLAVDRFADVAALADGADWTVAFLVDEDGQGQNLNDPALFSANWKPTNCNGFEDSDTDDYVLHWLRYSDFVATTNIVNTGLVGAGGLGEFVYVHPSDYVGVVSYEADEGDGGGCDLNGDGDTNDRIFRWVDSSNPSGAVLPVTDPQLLVALPTNLPGSADSTGGVVVVANLWVVVVDEAADGRDWDGVPGTDREWVLAHVPDNVGEGWNEDHGASNPAPAGVTWMAPDPRNAQRFLAALSEVSLDNDLNGDGDKLDSVPTFPEKLSGSTLTFPGVAVAVSPTNAGLATAHGFGFFRVSESEENRDINGDGDKGDTILHRLDLGGGDGPISMGTLHNQDTPAAVLGSEVGAFLTQESLIGSGGQDLNGDGDSTDYVVRYFRY